jgi:hypothetical protein
MDETTPYRKRFECAANPVLARAMREYMAKNGYQSERKAVESLLRESLINRGHLPPAKI